VQISTAHYVFPALYLNLQRAGFLHYLPEDLVGYMAHITDLNRERNAQIIAQANEINTLLRNNDITPIFLKGTGNLLEGLYPDIAERMVGDIDFIVEQPVFLKAGAILEQQGYESKNNINIGLHWHYPRLKHAEKIAAVEVHQKVLKYNIQFKLDIDLFSDVILLENKIFVLNIQNKLLVSTLPKIINDNLYYTKNISLRNAYDIYLLTLKETFIINRIPSKKTKKKLSDYLSCIELLLGNITIYEDLERNRNNYYKRDYIKLLENNKLEIRKNKFFKYITLKKNKFLFIERAFKFKSYRKYLLKRIFQLDFYKTKFGI